jgi:hypothetical protein
MNRFRNVFLGVLLSMLIAMPALASESQIGFPDSMADASLVFESNDAKPMQLAELSSQEMKETDGASHIKYHSHLHSHYGPAPYYFRSNHRHRHQINGHHGLG